MKKLFLLLILLWGSSLPVWAQEIYTFNCTDSIVQGQIKYALIGAYAFSFKDCRGSISYNPKEKQITSVDVHVKINSIVSNCPTCNKIAVSRKLLYASHFPYISFYSHSFENENGKFRAFGMINLHGKSQKLTSPFILKHPAPDELLIKGHWLINRHHFDVIWNKVLDHGGILVGDIVQVNWEVHAHKN